MRLWVDDLRPAPSEDAAWVHMVSSEAAIAQLDWWRSYGVPVEEVSLDHDLGGDDTSMPVVDWMREHDCWPDEVTVHTANPVGRENLLRALNADAPAEVAISIRTW